MVSLANHRTMDVVLRSDCAYAHADLELHRQHMACGKCFLWQNKSQFLTLSAPSKMQYADSVAPDQHAHPRSQSDMRAIMSVCLDYSSTDLPADSEALRSDCGGEQADLELHCPHMTYATNVPCGTRRVNETRDIFC